MPQQELHNGDPFDIEFRTFLLRFPDSAANKLQPYKSDGEVCAEGEINPLTFRRVMSPSRTTLGAKTTSRPLSGLSYMDLRKTTDWIMRELRIVQTSTGQAVTFTVHTERPNVLAGEVAVGKSVAESRQTPLSEGPLNVNQMNPHQCQYPGRYSIEAGSYVPVYSASSTGSMTEYGAIDIEIPSGAGIQFTD